MTNPATDTAKADTAERKRVPMSIPRRKLEVSDIKGYHLYWFLDQNVPAAIQAGYEHVLDTEVTLNQQGVGTSKEISGNASLGSNVSVVAGPGAHGKGENLNLMKIRDEWYDADRKAIEEGNMKIMDSIFVEEKIQGADKQSADDRSKSYVKEALFTPARNKRGK